MEHRLQAFLQVLPFRNSEEHRNSCLIKEAVCLKQDAPNGNIFERLTEPDALEAHSGFSGGI